MFILFEWLRELCCHMIRPLVYQGNIREGGIFPHRAYINGGYIIPLAKSLAPEEFALFAIPLPWKARRYHMHLDDYHVGWMTYWILIVNRGEYLDTKSFLHQEYHAR